MRKFLFKTQNNVKFSIYHSTRPQKNAPRASCFWMHPEQAAPWRCLLKQKQGARPPGPGLLALMNPSRKQHRVAWCLLSAWTSSLVERDRAGRA